MKKIVLTSLIFGSFISAFGASSTYSDSVNTYHIVRYGVSDGKLIGYLDLYKTGTYGNLFVYADANHTGNLSQAFTFLDSEPNPYESTTSRIYNLELSSCVAANTDGTIYYTDCSKDDNISYWNFEPIDDSSGNYNFHIIYQGDKTACNNNCLVLSFTDYDGNGQSGIYIQKSNTISEGEWNKFTFTPTSEAYDKDYFENNTSINEVSGPGDSSQFYANDILNILVVYNDATTIDLTNGTPYIDITIGSKETKAYIGKNYENATISSLGFAFEATIPTGVVGDANISFGDTIVLNGATITDAAGFTQNNSLNNIHGITDIVILDGIRSQITGAIWSTKNVGAERICESLSDESCYGDYFQWGRGADGHQKADSNTTPTQEEHAIQTSDLFVIGHKNWTSADATNLVWANEGIDGYPCQSGYKVAAFSDIIKEVQTGDGDINTTLNTLKIPLAGYRSMEDGSFVDKGSVSYLWLTDELDSNGAYFNSNKPVTKNITDNVSNGYPVRCLKY